MLNDERRMSMKPIFSDSVYNVLKYICLYGLPSITLFWAAIGTIWGIPYTTEIERTLVAINALLGGLLGISTMQFNKIEKKGK